MEAITVNGRQAGYYLITYERFGSIHSIVIEETPFGFLAAQQNKRGGLKEYHLINFWSLSKEEYFSLIEAGFEEWRK